MKKFYVIGHPVAHSLSPKIHAMFAEQCGEEIDYQSIDFEPGSFIETEYRALASERDVTLLEVHLITGKTHQIRAHLASEGHPVIGDYKYGDRTVNDRFREKYGLSSQLLHSFRLCFPKCCGELTELSRKEIQAPVPKLFLRICRDKGVM